MKTLIMIRKGYQEIGINVTKVAGIPFLESDLYWEYN